MEKQRIKISKSSFELGFSNVQNLTGIKGRWDILGSSPKIICDTAHNTEGLSLVLEQLQKESYDNLHIVLGFVNDKSLDDIIELFPVSARYYFCKPDIPRGLDSDKLRRFFSDYNLNGKAYSSVKEALFYAKSISKHNDLIFIGGSTFVVAEVI